MEICSRFTGMERKNGAFLLHTDNANVKVCFVTDEIVRVRASFDHELAEESYVLMTTAWEDRIKLLPDAALYRSTRIHHTPDSYTKRELVGARPLHLAYARPFGRLKAPLGLSLLHFAAQTRTCRGGPLHLAGARPLGRLKAPLGLSLLRKRGIYCSIGFIVGNSSTSRMEALSVSSITRRSTPKPRPPVGGRPYSSAFT